MMLRYTTADARRWASFSGDNNPLHFDADHARRCGCEGIVAHGMRVMVDIKKNLTEFLLSQRPLSDAWCFTARLRQPLLCDRDYRLTLRVAGERLRADVTDPQRDSECLSASIISAQARDGLAETSVRPLYRVEPSRSLFPGDAEAATERWSFWDAMLFRQLLASEEFMLAMNAAEPTLRARHAEEVFARLPVIQTHHETHFSARLLLEDFESGPGVAIPPIQVLGDRQRGLLVRAEIHGMQAAGRPLISTAITLKVGSFND